MPINGLKVVKYFENWTMLKNNIPTYLKDISIILVFKLQKFNIYQ